MCAGALAALIRGCCARHILNAPCVPVIYLSVESTWVGVSEAQEEHWLGPRLHGDRECSQPGIMVTLGVVLVHTIIIPATDSSTAS